MKLHKLLVGLLVMGLLVCLSTAQDAVDDAEDDSDVEEDDGAAEEVTPGVPREKPQYKAPEAKGNAFFSEAFESQSAAEKTWVISQAKKDGADEAIAKYDGKWEIEEASDNPMVGDLGLVLKTKAKHHAISAALDRPFKFEGNPLIVQYEVKFQNDQECGGAYVKLLSQDAKLNLPAFNDQTPYTIMFGPDKCGQDHKLHFIFRHKNPIKGTFEEKHAKKPTADLSKYFTDKKTHLYTLAVHPDNMFEVFVDQELINSGSLLEDMTPAVNPPKEIVDPNDSKPADWDEREKIADPEAAKPEDWDEDEPEMITDPDAKKPEGWLDDEPELIPDPEAEKPTDWDDDMDGEWEAPQINNPKCADAPGCGTWKAPQIKNPKYKGKWRAPMIDNPNYKGKWKPSMIANPDYFEDKQPFKMTPIAAIGLELWSMSNEILFDNFIITDSKTVADNWAEDSWEIKHAEEIASKSSGSLVNAVKDMTAERPWLWAVILIVVILPIVLLIAYCCSGSGSSEKEQEAERKKTDAPSPDVEEEEEAEKEGSEEAAASTEDAAADPGAAGDAPAETTTTTKTKKASKAALEAEEVDEAEVSQESQEEEEEEGKEASDTEKRRTSPRKRRSRKD